ncbi:MAG: hypothetical protein IPH43_15730 [Xanthomonadales bacterium]|nr:hypothetical protein [Xanthomonadales bacterium]
MAVWAIGDIEGLPRRTGRLIDKPTTIRPAMRWFCGDTIEIAAVNRWKCCALVKSLNDRTVVTLGNHDLSCFRRGHPQRTGSSQVNPELRAVLFRPDREDFRTGCAIARCCVDRGLGTMMVHAGLAPGWDVGRAESVTRGIETLARADDQRACCGRCSATSPIPGRRACVASIARAPASTCSPHALLRCCAVASPSRKGMPGTPAARQLSVVLRPGIVRRDLRIVCGHWSTLGRFAGLGVYAIDTGCVWGGALTGNAHRHRGARVRRHRFRPARSRKARTSTRASKSARES